MTLEFIDEDLCEAIQRNVGEVNWPKSRAINPALLEELSKKYGIQAVSGNIQNAILNSIKEEIKKTLGKKPGVKGRAYFNRLYNHLVYRHILFGKGDLRCIAFVHYLFGIYNNEAEIEPLTPDRLIHVVDCVLDICRMRDFPPMATPPNPSANRQVSVATCVLFLKEEFCICPRVEDGKLIVEEFDLRRVCVELESKVQQYGGANLVDSLQLHLTRAGQYDDTQQRFHVVAYGNAITGKTGASIPFGYLFNLGLKHARSNFGRPQAGNSTLLEDILKIATSVVAALDLEPYSAWDTEFRAGDGVIRLLQDVVRFDANFKIPQIRAADAKRVLNGLFGWVELSFYDEGERVKNLIQFGCALCDVVRAKTSSAVVTEGTLNRLYGKRKCDLEEPLKVFSHDTDPNQEFSTPFDWHFIDADTRPLIRVKDHTYWLPLQGWTVCAVIEAIRDYYRNKYPGFEETLGGVLEDFVRKELETHAVSVKAGKYREKKGVELELDAAIQSRDRIAVLEAKKKPLTKAGTTGHDHSLLVDVGKSLLDSQIQALRHAVNLIDNKKIEFLSGATLEHSQREIERISISLMDFGGLQDRTIIRQILPLFYAAQFSRKDLKTDSHLNELNIKCQTFRRLCDRWVELIGPGVSPFHDCSSMSLPQLLIVLDGVKGEEMFMRALMRTKHIALKSLDFYFEFKEVASIRDGDSVDRSA